MAIAGIDHINIDTDRLDETVAFYTNVLGLKSRPKPSGNDGVWLHLGERAIVHVNTVDDDRCSMPTGAFNHVAFTASDIDALTAALAAGSYEHQVSPRPELGITQIFTTDPNGISVELNIPNDS